MNALVTEQVPQTTAVADVTPKSPGQCHRSEHSSQKGGPGGICQARLFLRHSRFAQAQAADRNHVH